jgi:hypothetical protein
MSVLQHPIERKLSRVFGTPVTFSDLKISPLSGRLDAFDMVVTGASGELPLLRIGKISAQVAVARALAGQIVLKSLTVESPRISIFRRRDGTFNLPPWGRYFSTAASAAAPQSSSDTSFSLEARSMRIQGGQISFADGSYRASAGPINTEITIDDRRARVVVTTAHLAREDVPLEFGPVAIDLNFDRPTPPHWLPQTPATGTIRLHGPAGPALTFTSPNPAARTLSILLTGVLDVTRVLAALPSASLLPKVFLENLETLARTSRLDYSWPTH